MLTGLLVFAAGSSAWAAVGAFVVRSERRHDLDQAETVVARAVANGAMGVPYRAPAPLPAPTAGPAATAGQPGPGTPPAGSPTRGACHGTLTSHEDGSTTCHGGLWDCQGQGSRYTHARTVSCQTQSHGCGTCDAVRGMGVEPDPPRVADTTCARGCGQPGVVWVAASGSMPTLVCSRCADAIKAGRFWRGAA